MTSSRSLCSDSLLFTRYSSLCPADPDCQRLCGHVAPVRSRPRPPACPISYHPVESTPMSAKASGRVWDLDLPHNKRLVLLAMADHADHEGRNIYPSTDLIAWKTGYSSRQIQRVIDTLIADGILVVVEKARQQRPVTYALDFSAGKIKEPFQGRQNVIPQGRQNVTSKQSRGDISTHPGVTFRPSRGDIAMSPEPWNHDHEPPTPTAHESKNGGGDGDFFRELRRRGVGKIKAQEIAAKRADPDRVLHLIDTRPGGCVPSSPEFGRLINDILDGVAGDYIAPVATPNGAATPPPTKPNMPDEIAPVSNMLRMPHPFKRGTPDDT